MCQAAPCVCNLYIPAGAVKLSRPVSVQSRSKPGLFYLQNKEKGFKSHLALFFEASSTDRALCYKMKCGPCVPAIGAELLHPYCFTYSTHTCLLTPVLTILNNEHPTSVQEYCEKVSLALLYYIFTGNSIYCMYSCSICMSAVSRFILAKRTVVS